MQTKSNGIVGILRNEVTFWITIMAIIVSSVIAFTTLSGVVYAQGEKDVRLRSEFDNFVIERREALRVINDKLDQVIVNQTVTQKDVEYIKTSVKSLQN